MLDEQLGTSLADLFIIDPDDACHLRFEFPIRESRCDNKSMPEELQITIFQGLLEGIPRDVECLRILQVVQGGRPDDRDDLNSEVLQALQSIGSNFVLPYPLAVDENKLAIRKLLM